MIRTRLPEAKWREPTLEDYARRMWSPERLAALARHEAEQFEQYMRDNPMPPLPLWRRILRRLLGNP